MFTEQQNAIEADMAPFGFIDNGIDDPSGRNNSFFDDSVADEFDLLVIANEEVWWSSASLSFSILTSLSFSLSLLHKAHNKPHPEPYLAAMRKLGLQPEDCIAFEDSPTGATAAVAAGVHTIGILTSQTAEAMGKIGVSHTIRDYRDLLREIEA